MARRKATAVHGDGAFDAFELAARRLELSGTLDASALGRVAEQIAEGVATVRWRIAGTTDDLGRPALDVVLDGAVPLECQRCLRTFAWPVAQRTQLLLARDEGELARLDEGEEHEVIAAGAPLRALDLVEDELLLTLPFAAHCERPDCTTAGLGEPILGAAEARGGSESPFGALAALRRPSAGKRKA
jgi:uncharacterized protein